MSATMSTPAADVRLWERFQEGRCSDQEIASSVVLQRWLRSRRHGLCADNPGEPAIAVAGLSESIDAFAPLLAPGAPFDAFATTMASAGFCGVFCDAGGVVAARRIAEPFQTRIAHTRLVEGAVWSERTRGTNGIGTTLFEQAPVAVVGAEHYELRNHGLACYAAPVRDIRERVVAVLDATGPVSAPSSFIHASVVATAAALEALIVARTYDAAIPGGLFELERVLERLPHAALLVESTSRVRRTNARFARLMLDASSAELARLVSRRFGDRSPWPADALPRSMRGLTIELEPVGASEDPFAAIVHVRPRHRRLSSATPAPPSPAFAAIVGNDPGIVAAREHAARFARSGLPVLLLAETGAGKEVFARAVHAASGRVAELFVPVNCGALAGTLLESELFGYGPGAFTGAAPAGRTGKLAAADGGTLFLDEVGEMSLAAQVALLRFLEDGTYFRVNEAVQRHADVRVVAATSRDLATLVAEGRFRSDLYYRLRGLVLRLPPLRERSDVRELAEALLERVAMASGRRVPPRLSRAAFECIERHDWPGNVRELRTALEYAIVLAGESAVIERWHLPADVEQGVDAPGGLRRAAERAALMRALDRSGGNLSAAARSLGVARSTLYRMLERHDLMQG